VNNTCPSCGALYNVTQKDVGRRIRCKKCGAALEVTEAGLEIEPAGGPAPASAPRPQPAGAEPEYEDEGDLAPRRRRDRDRGRRSAGSSIDVMQVFKDFGGVPTLLFGFGAFLVIVFLFMPIIGTAAVERAQGAVERLDLQWKTKERQMRKDQKSEADINKAREDFYKARDKDELDENVGYERVSNKRSRWFEMYGMMFGFLFLMAGSIGYMTPGQSTVRRILGTVVLGAQMLIIFMAFAAGGGCGGKGGPPIAS
jgi:predicted Zn finger-like uncharacterized protein